MSKPLYLTEKQETYLAKAGFIRKFGSAVAYRMGDGHSRQERWEYKGDDKRCVLNIYFGGMAPPVNYIHVMCHTSDIFSIRNMEEELTKLGYPAKEASNE
ncbi:hypothetical protein CEW46_30430 [Bacillus cereus]|nr:hypothetical protein CEW46_30430 [Bacillus cereus]